MNEKLSADELEELMASKQQGTTEPEQDDPIASAFGAVKVIPIPATMWVKFGENVAGFDASAAESFAYTPLGVFATGHWMLEEDSTEEAVNEDVLIPYAQIHHFEFHFPEEMVADHIEKDESGKDTSD